METAQEQEGRFINALDFSTINTYLQPFNFSKSVNIYVPTITDKLRNYFTQCVCLGVLLELDTLSHSYLL